MSLRRVELARALAAYAHEGQKDRAGADYILHPVAVAGMVDSEDEKVVALLHDVLEDTKVGDGVLRELFGDDVADAVVALTRKPGEDYMDFVRRAKRNRTARKVKIADLKHNMDVSRLPAVGDKDLKRLEKYREALAFLDC